MDIFFVCILAALFSYVIGSIPIAYLVGRKVESVDVREVGEGNVGARNVFHTVGHKWGSLVFLGDFGKGMIVASAVSDQSKYVMGLSGFFLFLGHGFPVWLKFLGGKGLSPVGGFTATLLPLSSLLGIGISALVWLFVRRFMPTTVTVIICAIGLAPFFGYSISRILIPIGLFVMVGAKRKLDEPRTRKIEGRNDWNRLTGGMV
ncbi:MAG: glycerol-3-phosphate acyltransferase [Acidimicrobiales bacterium]|jgi:glycerol-3-phosphate acyltransferase PlsY|nr:glycerol-3-phosphate acyltransferase [Acidimicrobiales bacterium]MDP6298089.1 glycerol-3-phosphate acyltransferase [Acidimicrobiales bacterium]HJM29389.1 glycerol-3-phosphate acyltransferase [Acidimicrobiales bacterium]HJM96819.1 glycerol-3-phosphate acyltransferase [Acidimicrobiales bacterium]